MVISTEGRNLKAILIGLQISPFSRFAPVQNCKLLSGILYLAADFRVFTKPPLIKNFIFDDMYQQILIYIASTTSS
jgi:hypothetical protein